MNGSTSSYLREVKRQHEAGTLTQEQATEFIVVTLINQAAEGETLVKRLGDLEKNLDKRFDELSQKIDDTIKHQKDHPSLVSLLRYRTRQTVVALIFIFMILSSWFVSSLRQPVLEFLGLPVF